MVGLDHCCDTITSCLGLKVGNVLRWNLIQWKAKMSTVCQGYEPKDIFNMDESGIFFKDSTKSTFLKKGRYTGILPIVVDEKQTYLTNIPKDNLNGNKPAEVSECKLREHMKSALKISTEKVDAIRFDRVHWLPDHQISGPTRNIMEKFTFFQDRELVGN